MTGTEWIAVLLGGAAGGWGAALLAATWKLSADVAAVHRELQALGARLDQVGPGAPSEALSGGTGGERPLSEGEIEPPP